MYILVPSPLFKKKYKKLVQKNRDIRKYVEKTLILLEKDPCASALGSHKVIWKQGKKAFSSSVTGDIRIIWDYHYGQAHILDILDIGGHEGGKKVYK